MKSLDRLLPNLELLKSLTENKVLSRLNNNKGGELRFSVLGEFSIINKTITEVVFLKTVVVTPTIVTFVTTVTVFTLTTLTRKGDSAGNTCNTSSCEITNFCSIENVKEG